MITRNISITLLNALGIEEALSLIKFMICQHLQIIVSQNFKVITEKSPRSQWYHV